MEIYENYWKKSESIEDSTANDNLPF
jgi:hypothetical protein